MDPGVGQVDRLSLLSEKVPPLSTCPTLLFGSYKLINLIFGMTHVGTILKPYICIRLYNDDKTSPSEVLSESYPKYIVG